MGRDNYTGRYVPIEEVHASKNEDRYTVIEFDKKLKEFRDMVYEPVHEEGGVCWCGVMYTKEPHGMAIDHKAQRDILTDFVRDNFKP